MLFFSENAKIREVKILKKKSITSRNFTATYYETLEEAHWLLRLEKPKKNDKIFQNLEKICQFFQKMQKCKVPKNAKLHRGADGGGNPRHSGGRQQRGGGGGNSGGSSTSKKRSSHHKYVSKTV